MAFLRLLFRLERDLLFVGGGNGGGNIVVEIGEANSTLSVVIDVVARTRSDTMDVDLFLFNVVLNSET